MTAFLQISLDVGGQADPAAINAMVVKKADGLTRGQIIHMNVRPPVVTPGAHVAIVNAALAHVRRKVGLMPVRFVIDISSNSGIALLLAAALPRDSIIAIRIAGGDAHSSGVSPFQLGEVNNRMCILPCLTLSRRQALFDVGAAMQQRLMTLPLDDPDEKPMLDVLKGQMQRASLKTTASGKQIAQVNRGHDDLLMSLAQSWVATKLPPPRSAQRTGAGSHKPAISPAAWT